MDNTDQAISILENFVDRDELQDYFTEEDQNTYMYDFDYSDGAMLDLDYMIEIASNHKKCHELLEKKLSKKLEVSAAFTDMTFDEWADLTSAELELYAHEEYEIRTHDSLDLIN